MSCVDDPVTEIYPQADGRQFLRHLVLLSASLTGPGSADDRLALGLVFVAQPQRVDAFGLHLSLLR